MINVLVTGAAGFIGFFLAKRLLEEGHRVVGVDNLNDYYATELKEARLRLLRHENFRFLRLDLADRRAVEGLFSQETFDRVAHLAAQAGVRYSLQNPEAYVDSNLIAFANVLEACRRHPPRHLVYASSSSVYGANAQLPFSVSANVDHPLSLYAATKKAGELMAHSYSHLYGLSTTGLRFFTVYGPWGRPDMAYFLFVRRILEGQPIQVFNQGRMARDFTYVDDIVEGVVRVLAKPAEPDPDWRPEEPDPATSCAPFRIYNIGRGKPVSLGRFIQAIESALGRTARIEYKPLQPGDMESTHADVTALEREVGYRPQTDLETGIRRFVAWYRDFYNV